ncbi:hypothetical protein BDZ97DRAFT_188115 [Flammula alnicola]|nr:hypothetical protein BDZ97DRAFT_188115 [Flammula alnicola]
MKNFRHALALLGEHRVRFKPNFFNRLSSTASRAGILFNDAMLLFRTVFQTISVYLQRIRCPR